MNEEKRKSMRDKLPPEALEHMKAARQEMRKSMETILPPGFLEHRRAARKEALLAFRSLIDAAIKKTEEKSSEAKIPASWLGFFCKADVCQARTTETDVSLWQGKPCRTTPRSRRRTIPAPAKRDRHIGSRQRSANQEKQSPPSADSTNAPGN